MKFRCRQGLHLSHTEEGADRCQRCARLVRSYFKEVSDQILKGHKHEAFPHCLSPSETHEVNHLDGRKLAHRRAVRWTVGSKE